MPITKEEAHAGFEEFKKEFPGLAHLTYIALETREDYEYVYGQNAAEAQEAWRGKKGSFSTTAQAITCSCEGNVDKGDLAATLRHEGLGHAGLLTYSVEEKRGILNAIVASRGEPSLAETWALVDKHYPDLSELKKAEEVFSLSAEKVGTREGFSATALRHVQKSVFQQGTEKLQGYGILQLAEQIAKGMREKTRTQQIWPRRDGDLFRIDTKHLPPERGAAAIERAPLTR